MNTAAHILIISAGPLITSIVVAVNAKRINTQARERREARLAKRS